MDLIEKTILAEREFRAGLAAIGEAIESCNGKISPTQALILCRLDPDDQPRTGDLIGRCYDGTNVSYNVRILIERRLIKRFADVADRRVSRISITERGFELRSNLRQLLGVDEPIDEVA